MKKTKTSLLLLSFIMMDLSLVACQDKTSDKGSSKKDDKIASIAIVKDSIASTYTIGSTVDYSKLAIETLNASKEVLNTLKASENKGKITYSTIDTSTLTDKRTFEVVLTQDNVEYKTSMDYKVIDVQYELNDWSANANYTSTVANKGNNQLTDPESGTYQNGFIKAAKYYVGNENAVNLLPTVTALNPEDPLDIVTLDKIPDGTIFSLKDESGEKVELENALENIDELKTKGTVKFQDDVTGVYTLTLSNPNLSNEIVYNINVVSGYNVSKAKDMYALNNSLNCGVYGSAYNEKMATFKKELGLPDSNGLVFQNDVTFCKSDLPTFYLWEKGEATDDSVVGSLKDWLGIIDHRFTKDSESVHVYGNGHRLMLNDDETDADCFPYIVTDSQNGEKQEANKPISSHAAFFYSDHASGVNPETCYFTIQDLEMSGNMGVSAESNIALGGPMLAKVRINTTMDNVIASKVYMPAMVEGYDFSSDGKLYNTTMNVNDCRFRDLFNSAIYIYGNGTLNVTHSEMMKAGGPLLFLNPITQELPSYPNDLSSIGMTDVNIDETSVLSNYTEGKGGWFDAYNGASALAAQLKNADALFNNQCKTSFLKTDNNVSKFDFWMVSLPINNESIELPVDKGGVNVDVTIGSKKAFSTLDGRDTVFQKAIAMSQEQSQANILSYVNSLTSTDFGNNLAYAATASAVTFKLVDEQNVPHYSIVNVKDNNYFLCDSQYALLSALGMDVSSMSYAPNEVFNSASNCLAATINGSAQSVNPQDPSTLKGVCNYGILLGNYKKLS